MIIHVGEPVHPVHARTSEGFAQGHVQRDFGVVHVLLQVEIFAYLVFDLPSQ